MEHYKFEYDVDQFNNLRQLELASKLAMRQSQLERRNLEPDIPASRADILNSAEMVEFTDDLVLKDPILYTNPVPDSEHIIFNPL